MRYILFLRGINLGKLNKVPMKDIKEFLMHYGFMNVKTYIQSGNVYVESNTGFDIDDLEKKLEKQYGFPIPVLIRTIEDLITISKHPLFNEDNVMVLFLKDTSNYSDIKDFVREDHVLLNNTIIIKYSVSYHKTKFTNNWFERKLHTHSTLRNKTTVLKLIELFS